MSTSAHEVAAGLRPFWGRVTVSESTVDEEQLDSGIVLPMTHEGDDGLVRGIVLHCSDRSAHGYAYDVDLLTPGTPVYYEKRAALKIAGVAILHHADIVAYEESP